MSDYLGTVAISETNDGKTYDVLDDLMGLSQPQQISSEEESEHQSHEENNEYDEYIDSLHTTIDKLRGLIDFFREEMAEKNLLIRALIFQNANDAPTVDFDLMHTEAQCPASSPHHNPNIPQEISTPIILTENDHAQDSSPEPQNNETDGEAGHDGDLDTSTSSSSSTSSTSSKDTGSLFKFEQKFPWEKHNNGVGSQILDKMNYKGGGLGKNENGIGEPITVAPADLPKTSKNTGKAMNREKVSFVREVNEPQNRPAQKKKKKMYIISDSMLNGLDEKRLARDNFDVKLSCHGGCTIGCAYMHLDPVVTYNPDVILVHIGTNDCSSKWSYDVYDDLKDFFVHINSLLPRAEIVISLPTYRTDNSKANVTLTNFSFNLVRNNEFNYLDNSNIYEQHLGKKGLHFNSKGVKQIAKNIISFIDTF